MTNEFQNKLTTFWSDFNKSDFTSKARCAELAGEIISELESLSSDAIGYLTTLVLTLGSETSQHSAPVDSALRAARQFLRAEAKASE
jgi:hypothetical protein